MRILFGLGNPGKKYNNTRHNAGFMFIDEFAKQHGFPEFKSKLFGEVSEMEWEGEKTMLIKPDTFINLSGNCVEYYVNYYKVEPENVWVIYDDVDLKSGDLRIKMSGGPGTHNGMRSIIKNIPKIQKSPRLRLGIESRGTHAPEQMSLAAFVLAPFSPEERKEIDAAISTGISELKKALA